MDAEDLKLELFGLFEERRFWTKVQLNNRLDRPEQHLSMVLKMITRYHRDGDHKGMYELMEQYR